MTNKNSSDKFQSVLRILNNTFAQNRLQSHMISQLRNCIKYFYPSIYDQVYIQGEKILDYYFLLSGTILLTKISQIKNQIDHYTPTTNKSQHKNKIIQSGVIGQYFYSDHRIRQFTCIVQEQNCLIAKISAQSFQAIFSKQIKNKIDLQQKSSFIFKVPKQMINLEQFITKKLTLYENITSSVYGIILSGQLTILARKKNIEQKKVQNIKKKQLPELVRLKLKPMNQLLIIGQNQWFGIQNLFETDVQFRYSAVSEKVQILIIPESFIVNTPAFQNGLIQRIHNQRVNRFKSMKSGVREKKQFAISKIEMKRKIKAAQILNQLDPNLSPKMIRQNFQLGFQKVCYQLNEKKQRKSCEGQFSPKFKKQRKTAIQSENRDWSYYLKVGLNEKKNKYVLPLI